jgi:hypothetical protein
MNAPFSRHLLLALSALLLWLGIALPSVAAADTLPAAPPDRPALTAEDAPHPRVPQLRTDASLPPLVFHYPTAYQARLDALLPEAREALQKVLGDFPDAPLPPVHVYLLPEIERYFTAQQAPVRSPHWASGLALLGEDVILIRLLPAVVGGKVEVERTLAHELSHVVLHNMTGKRPLPTWFIEGLAMFQTEPWDFDRSQRLGEAIQLDKVLPLDTFAHGFPPDHHTAQLAYAESAHFLYWLNAQYGRGTIRDLLARLHQGEPFADAFEAATGEPFWVIEGRWRAGLTVQDAWLSVLLEGGVVLVSLVGLALLMLYARRRRLAEVARMEAMGRAEPPVKIPSHLQRFGPFTRGNQRLARR